MKDKIKLYVDGRALQDPGLQFRGVGTVSASLLQHCHDLYGEQIHMVALLDEHQAPLPEKYCAFFAEQLFHTNITFTAPCLFFQLSPMTHPPLWISRFLGHHKVFAFTLVYDFIPFEHPGYLANDGPSFDYMACLKWLKFYDHYFPISGFTQKKLQDIIHIADQHITRMQCSIRQSLTAAAIVPSSAEKNYFLTVAGDRRKNVEILIKALQQLNLGRAKPYELKIIGQYTGAQIDNFYNLYGLPHPKVIECVPWLDDAALASLYAHSIATIVPSLMEGFSLPVIEAIVCNAPVLASKIEAHQELVKQPEALFAPDDAIGLMKKMLQLASSFSSREALLLQQKKSLPCYDEVTLAQQFWSGIIKHYQDKFSAPYYLHLQKNKPTVAFLTPYPPDESGIADYSYATVQACAPYFNTTVFSNAVPGPSAAITANITPYALLAENYDAVISVLGNSHYHSSILDIAEKFGGPCILHDSRLTGIYFARLGAEQFQQAANYFLKKVCTHEEITAWLTEKKHPSLFLDYIIKKAHPLIVHTQRIQAIIAEMYQKKAIHVPFSSRLQFTDKELSEKNRLRAKKRLGLEGKFIISSFGFPLTIKYSADCLLALDQLLSWGVPAYFCMVGKYTAAATESEAIVTDLNIQENVRFFSDQVSEADYIDYLLASDCGIQLRSFDLGQPSGSLTDCIAAGLPCVATDTLAEACDAPDYVRRINQKTSPLLIAEKIAEIYEEKNFAQRISAQRTHFCHIHSFANYAHELNKAIFL